MWLPQERVFHTWSFSFLGGLAPALSSCFPAASLQLAQTGACRIGRRIPCACTCVYVCVRTYTHIQHTCKVWGGWRGEGRLLTLRFRASTQMWGLWGLQRCRLPTTPPAVLDAQCLSYLSSPDFQIAVPRLPRALGWGLLLGYSDPNGDNFRQTHMWSSSKTNCILLNSFFYVLKSLGGDGVGVGRRRTLSENYTLHLPFCCS